MSPEAVNYMSIAEAIFDRANRSWLAEIYENVARDAYGTALNAARAVIFDKTGIAPKTHSGTRAKFLELVHTGLAFDGSLADFLSEGFDVKQGVEYGPEVVIVSRAKAKEYLGRTGEFLAAAKAICERS